jgi:FtsP/CotA-like multicopper oxidase with cupredoxin domain
MVKNKKVKTTSKIKNIIIFSIILFFIIITSLFFLIHTSEKYNNKENSKFELDNKNPTLANENLNVKKLNYTTNLKLKASRSFLEYNNKNLEVYSYNGVIPAPTIKGKINDRIVVNLENNLNEETSIHWHGLQIENNMDGVPGLTQDSIKPKKSFIYNFTLKNPGIYWYHPHFETFKQIDMGLYGALIVDDENEKLIKSDKDEIIFLDDFRLQNNKISTKINMHDVVMGGKYGNRYLINGKEKYELKVEREDLLRLRLINPSNARIYALEIEDLDFLVIGKDIGLLKKAYKTKTIIIAPGERYDVLISINSNKKELEIRNFIQKNKYDLIGKIKINPQKSKINKNGNKNYLDNLQTKILNYKIDTYLKNKTSIEKNLEFKLNRSFGMRNFKWTMNGKSLKENPEIMNLKNGQYYKIKLKNLDNGAHPIHIHGQKFLVLNRTYDVKNSINEGFRDTVLIYGNEEIEIGFVAEGIGNWLTHCHILEHSSFGMGAIFKINK